jgi:hypothetical protein
MEFVSERSGPYYLLTGLSLSVLSLSFVVSSENAPYTLAIGFLTLAVSFWLFRRIGILFDPQARRIIRWVVFIFPLSRTSHRFRDVSGIYIQTSTGWDSEGPDWIFRVCLRVGKKTLTLPAEFTSLTKAESLAAELTDLFGPDSAPASPARSALN